MRKYLMVGVVGLAALSAPTAKADLLSDVTNVVKAIVEKGPQYACSKGVTFSLSPKPTLRSFDGRFCGDIRIAAMTQAVCPSQASDFATSKCNTIGKETLGSKTPKDVLSEQIKLAPAPIKQLACKLSAVAPDATIKSAMSLACG